MSQVEDEIRDSLRAEAARLREVRPLRLPPEAVHDKPRRARRASLQHVPRAWLAPAAIAAAIVLVAATLVTVRALTNLAGDSTANNGIPPIPSTAYATTPRYYVGDAWVTPAGDQGRWAIVVGDARTGKRVGFYALPVGGSIGWAASGAADDRTFVVSAQVDRSGQQWYLVRIFPGSGYPVRVTPLAIQATPVTSKAPLVPSIAVSADGTQLAVETNTSTSVGLSVYSVASGQLRHSWSAAITGGTPVGRRVADLSWVGDSTVGFAFIDTWNVKEDVRTLDVGSAGTDLLADSHVVWSQHVPPPASGTYGKSTRRTCDTPFLTGDGQAVVCGASSYSASAKRLSAVWLAYPLTTPDRPRVIGSVQEPKDVTSLRGPIAVEWTNSSGTEVIGTWDALTSVRHDTSPMWHRALIGHGTVRSYARITPGIPNPSW